MQGRGQDTVCTGVSVSLDVEHVTTGTKQRSDYCQDAEQSCPLRGPANVPAGAPLRSVAQPSHDLNCTWFREIRPGFALPGSTVWHCSVARLTYVKRTKCRTAPTCTRHTSHGALERAQEQYYLPNLLLRQHALERRHRRLQERTALGNRPVEIAVCRHRHPAHAD
jgi:hypothetical protein